MAKISRTDEITNPEKGGEVFDEFLKLLKNNEALFNTITGVDTKKAKVEEVVADYREAIGLDLIKTAAANPVPIAPMKLKKVQSPEELLEKYKPEDLLVQQKYDGWKSQVIKNGGTTKIYSRRGEEFEENVPKLATELNDRLDNGDFVLGEIIYVENGKQNISDLQTITGSNKEKALEFQKNNKGKVVLQAYDLLWNKGEDCTKKPYSERYADLKKKIGKSADVQIPHNYSWNEKETAIKDALKVGGEGIVIKPKDSKYEYAAKGNNEPTGEWVKFKPGNKAHETDVIVKEYTEGKGKLIFPAYQHQNGKLVEVSKISGLPKEDEEYVKKQIDSGKQVVLEVGYQEIMESGKLRHPGFHRVRKDKSPKEVKARLLSKRAGILELHPDIKTIIDSYCHNSGGTKSLHSIINFLRERFGSEVKFTDQELKDYIESRKKHFKVEHSDEFNANDVGKVGIEGTDSYEDSVADYFTHGK